MKKLYIACILICTVLFDLKAQTQLYWSGELSGLKDSVVSVFRPKIHTDHSGNIFSAGCYKGAVDFDPGSGTELASDKNITSNSYVVKMDPAGNMLWSRQLYSKYENYVAGIVTDLAGNVFICGSYIDSIFIYPGFPGLRSSIPQKRDYYIIKYDKNGNPLWATSRPALFTTNNEEYEISLAIDGAGSVWAAGFLNGTPRFVIQKYTNAGDLLYSDELESHGVVGRIYAGPKGTMYVTGHFGGNVDFKPGIGTFMLNTTSPGNYSGYVACFDTSTAFYWAKPINLLSSQGDVTVLATDFDTTGNMYLLGRHGGIVDFDPDPSVHMDTAAIHYADQFILKLTPVAGFIWLRTVSSNWAYRDLNSLATDSIGNVYVAGSFDSKLSVNNNEIPRELTTPATAQGVVIKLTSSGSIDWTKQTGGSSTSDTYCRSIDITPGGDLLQTGEFNGTINADWYNVHSTQLHAPGKSYYVYMLRTGICSPGNTMIKKTGKTLTTDITSGDYQWKDCITGLDIPGATGKNFTPARSGKYRLIVSKGGCVDSSQCQDITLGIDDKVKSPAHAVIYPNPGNGAITITLNSVCPELHLEIRNVLGQLVERATYHEVQKINTYINGPAGSYFIRLTVAGGQPFILPVTKE